MSNDLVKASPYSSLSLPDVKSIGQIFAQSGFFADAKSEAQAVVKLIYGQELGLTPVVAMTGIHIIQGKPSLSAGAIASILRRSGRYDFRVTEHTDTACAIEFFMDGQAIGNSRYTLDDAQMAGALLGANGHSWKKFPKNMLYARAISNGAKWHCPDVFGGPVYIPEEMGALVDGESGDVIPQPNDPKSWPAAGVVLEAAPVAEKPSAPPIPPQAPKAAENGKEPANPAESEVSVNTAKRQFQAAATERGWHLDNLNAVKVWAEVNAPSLVAKKPDPATWSAKAWLTLIEQIPQEDVFADETAEVKPEAEAEQKDDSDPFGDDDPATLAEGKAALESKEKKREPKPDGRPKDAEPETVGAAS